VNGPAAVANPVTVAVGKDGRVRVENRAGSLDVVADLAGYFAPDAGGSRFTPVTPYRLFDTRTQRTVTGLTGPGPGGQIDVPIAGQSGIPSNATGVVFNYTGTSSTAATYIEAYPAPATRSGFSFPKLLPMLDRCISDSYDEPMDDRLENLLGALVLAVSDSLTTVVKGAAGHSGALGAALAVLAQDPGLGIEDLRRQLGRTQSATVRVVDQLVAGGLAKRGPGGDRRSISVVLTARGSAAAARVLKARAVVLRDALVVLDPGERNALTAMLEKMLDAVTEDRAHAEQICRLCDLGTCPLVICPVEHAAGGEPRPRSRAGPVVRRRGR
jgi:MarR family transcriptional regulator, negative regulator of the multidrug operon emrRAB